MSPIKFQYPEEGWSTGRMRKRGERPEPEEDARPKMVADWQRRGRPEFSGAEMERAAGFGLSARGATAARSEATKGAGGLSPETIAEHKAQIQALGQQYQLGTIKWGTLRKEIRDMGWAEAGLELVPGGSLVGGALKALREKPKEQKAIQLRDPNGDVHSIELGGFEE